MQYLRAFARTVHDVHCAYAHSILVAQTNHLTHTTICTARQTVHTHYTAHDRLCTSHNAQFLQPAYDGPCAYERSGKSNWIRNKGSSTSLADSDRGETRQHGKPVHSIAQNNFRGLQVLFEVQSTLDRSIRNEMQIWAAHQLKWTKIIANCRLVIAVQWQVCTSNIWPQ